MEAKYTRGPWSVDPQDDYFAFAGAEIRPAENPDYDFRVEFSDHVSTGEQAGTVHLIAAAPDLLASLKELATKIRAVREFIGLEEFDVCFVEADAAIAKAEGAAETV